MKAVRMWARGGKDRRPRKFGSEEIAVKRDHRNVNFIGVSTLLAPSGMQSASPSSDCTVVMPCPAIPGCSV